PDQGGLLGGRVPADQGHVLVPVDRVSEGHGAEPAAPRHQVGFGDVAQVECVFAHLPPSVRGTGSWLVPPWFPTRLSAGSVPGRVVDSEFGIYNLGHHISFRGGSPWAGTSGRASGRRGGAAGCPTPRPSGGCWTPRSRWSTRAV